ncbi:MAG TPA: DUF167 domain-containing protein [Lacipirellula sp.]
MVNLEEHPRGVMVPVRVKAGARRTGIAGEHNGALRVDVSAAPEKGKANKAVAEVLAELFGVAKSSVELASGPTSSQKRFLIHGVDMSAVQRMLAAD